MTKRIKGRHHETKFQSPRQAIGNQVTPPMFHHVHVHFSTKLSLCIRGSTTKCDSREQNDRWENAVDCVSLETLGAWMNSGVGSVAGTVGAENAIPLHRRSSLPEQPRGAQRGAR
jgi:hypothetical protein